MKVSFWADPMEPFGNLKKITVKKAGKSIKLLFFSSLLFKLCMRMSFMRVFARNTVA